MVAWIHRQRKTAGDGGDPAPAAAVNIAEEGGFHPLSSAVSMR